MSGLRFQVEKGLCPRFLPTKDRACIHQRDPERKVLGVMNVGAFLHKSESLLVIWDPSSWDLHSLMFISFWSS